MKKTEFFLTKVKGGDLLLGSIGQSKYPIIGFVFLLTRQEWENLIIALQMTSNEKFLGWNGIGYDGIMIDSGKPMTWETTKFSEAFNEKLAKHTREIKKYGLAATMNINKGGVNIIMSRKKFNRFREFCLIQNSKFGK